jgi:hypothetical protein
MVFIIAISLASLVSIAGVFLLIKVKKDNLGWFYKVAAYKTLAVGAILIIVTMGMGICKLSHCGGGGKNECFLSCKSNSSSDECTANTKCSSKKGKCCSKTEKKKCHAESEEPTTCSNNSEACEKECKCDDGCTCSHCAAKTEKTE